MKASTMFINCLKLRFSKCLHRLRILTSFPDIARSYLLLFDVGEVLANHELLQVPVATDMTHEMHECKVKGCKANTGQRSP